jgi:1-deoxy-D-xylulose-5-phosphate reductoisomerase
MIVLGSTGSIGVNTLCVAKEFGIQIEALVAGRNYKLLQKQIDEFKPKYVVVADKEIASKIKHNDISYSKDSIIEIIKKSKSDLVVNALVGFLGLKPTIEAIKLGKNVALANKESLVVAGKFIDMSKIKAIDSEHFGLWYLQKEQKINRLIITASGGAFRDTSLDKLRDVSVKEALNHPNWSMGNKITIDSATMVNKLFELIEAKWLFGIDKIDAVIEKSSMIHSLVEFIDGSTTAHIARADMRLPIAFAVLDKVDRAVLKPVNLTELKAISFEDIKTSRYPIWQIKDEFLSNPDLGVIINASNEIAVEKFLNEKISFIDISEYIFKAVAKFRNIKIHSIDDIFVIDKEVREFTKKI